MNEEERRALEEVRAMLAPLTVYTVERILGVGGAGYVLRVRHRVFGPRAMKLVHPALLKSQIIRERFDTEASIMHSLSHQNVVRVHELGEVGDFPYLVMDFLEGGTLDQHLSQFGKMPPKQAVRVAIAILRGLQAAHDQGVVHRDVKPQNILFDKDGTPKITDFGIARVGEGSRFLTREGSTMGTFAYMPPEQLAGELDLIDHRADVHAMGVTLYVMLTCGKLGQEAFFRQLEKYPERLDDVPDVLQMVIRMATSESPESRFESAAAMADELEIYLASGLPDDPADTPALGSAPGVKAELEGVFNAAQPVHEASGMQPVLTRAQPGYEVSASPDGAPVVSQAGFAHRLGLARLPETDSVQGASDAPPTGTILPPVDQRADQAQIDALRNAAKRRVLRHVAPIAGAVLLVLAVVGVWFATRSEPKPEPAASEPIAQIAPPAPVEQPMPLPALAVPEPTVVALQPTPTPAPVVRAQPTSRVTPLPQTEVAIVEKAQVRLVLKADTMATVTLSGEGGTFTLTGGTHEVPQGTYRVSVEMPGREAPQTGTLTVAGTTTITCDSRFKMCTGLK
ncbi:protein kinase [Candidatus Uhrbacteria bacterium]|nr:protein kinase [Candidatus Uhrbacteria bacterium]